MGLSPISIHHRVSLLMVFVGLDNGLFWPTIGEKQVMLRNGKPPFRVWPFHCRKGFEQGLRGFFICRLISFDGLGSRCFSHSLPSTRLGPGWNSGWFLFGVERMFNGATWFGPRPILITGFTSISIGPKWVFWPVALIFSFEPRPRSRMWSKPTSTGIDPEQDFKDSRSLDVVIVLTLPFSCKS